MDASTDIIGPLIINEPYIVLSFHNMNSTNKKSAWTDTPPHVRKALTALLDATEQYRQVTGAKLKISGALELLCT